MRITVTVPDELGREVKERTSNVSAYVTDALEERLHREKRRQAREELLEMAGKGRVDPDIHAVIQRERREGDRDFPDAQQPAQGRQALLPEEDASAAERE